VLTFTGQEAEMRAMRAGLCVLWVAACGGDPDGDPMMVPPDEVKAPEIGKGDHTAASVTLTVIATSKSGEGALNRPRDLAFNPLRPDELWIVNDGDDSMTIVSGASQDTRTSENRYDVAAEHFMKRSSSIAFGADATTIGKQGTFATCGETLDRRNNGPGNTVDFMGPVLWSSDLSVFAKMDPDGLGSHLDMLHVSPLCMGIAHQEANIYWTVCGRDGSIVKYDFHDDHGVGQDDHADGEERRYAMGLLGYVEDVPSHIFYRAADKLLYIADTGNQRIAKLDTKDEFIDGNLATPDGFGFTQAAYFKMGGEVLSDVVPASTKHLEAPSGLEIKGDFVYVSDHQNGRISAFTLAGERVNYLDTGLGKGALSGMAFGPDGKLYVVDMVGHRVLRIDSK
jgi:hypothetical protein